MVGVHRFRFKNIPRHVLANPPPAPRVNFMANRNVDHLISYKPQPEWDEKEEKDVRVADRQQ